MGNGLDGNNYPPDAHYRCTVGAVWLRPHGATGLPVLLAALVGVCLWKLTSNPLVAVGIVIAVDALAAWLTFVKTWEAPQTETLISWVLSTIAAGLNILSAGSLQVTIIAYAVYSLLANGTITATIIHRRRVLK